MIDPVHNRGRKAEADKTVRVCITVPLWLKLAMVKLSTQKRTTVSVLTSRCYERLAEFHAYKKSDLVDSQ